MRTSGKVIWLLVFLLIVRPGSMVRAEMAETNLSLSAVEEVAIRDNADLKRLRAQWEAMLERPVQAGAPANPMLTYGGMDAASGGVWPDTGEKRIMVQQELPGRGKRALRAGVAASDAEAARQELEIMTRDVVMMVKESYFDLYAVRRIIELTGEEQRLVRQAVDVVETQYGTGERSQADVVKAHAEVTQLKQKLLEAQAREVVLAAKLNMLMNRKADRPVGRVVLPEGKAFSGGVESLLALAVKSRPELKAVEVKIERSDLEKKLMEKESRPDYKVGLEYRDVGMGDDMVMFTVGVDLPIWNSKVKAGVGEAEKRRVAGESEREAVRRQTEFDVQEAFSMLRATRQVLTLYREELIPQAEARRAASGIGYRTGKADFMEFVESERFALGVKMMVAMSEGAVGMRMARLERAIGAPPFTAGAAEGEGK